MEKCVSCQFYDRKSGKESGDSRAIQWGQCRRTAPMLNPVNTKSYMIEGVWPTVRDDDWCGEWKVPGRRVDPRITESLTTPLVAATSPIPATVPRVAPLTGAAAASAIGSGLPPSQRPGSLMPAGAAVPAAASVAAVAAAAAASAAAGAPRISAVGGDD